MDANSTNSTLHFPVRRDGWDTLDFYLLFFSSMLSTGTFCVLKAIVLLNQSLSSPLAWFMLLHGLIAFGFGLWLVVCNIWQRFAEEYVMTREALIFEYGFRRVRVPYDDIVALHPIKVCRSTSALKPAHRINFRKPIGMNRAADAYPVNSGSFLDELAARCPHLEREGPRMHLCNMADATTTN